MFLLRVMESLFHFTHQNIVFRLRRLGTSQPWVQVSVVFQCEWSQPWPGFILLADVTFCQFALTSRLDSALINTTHWRMLQYWSISAPRCPTLLWVRWRVLNTCQLRLKHQYFTCFLAGPQLPFCSSPKT